MVLFSCVGFRDVRVTRPAHHQTRHPLQVFPSTNRIYVANEGERQFLVRCLKFQTELAVRAAEAEKARQATLARVQLHAEERSGMNTLVTHIGANREHHRVMTGYISDT